MEWHKNWFSNMLPFDDPLIEDGISYRTSEHYYQAHKTEDLKDRLEISLLGPHQAKRKLASGKYPIRHEWNTKMKLSIMRRALMWKFAKGTTWYEKLKATEGEEIVEWNNWSDLWWGKDLETKQGRNELGKLLMDIRAAHMINEVFECDFCSQCMKTFDTTQLHSISDRIRYCSLCLPNTET
jgi:ribA/ribD-fused uncharacterized protein